MGERERFESWARSFGSPVYLPGAGFSESAWTAWQARALGEHDPLNKHQVREALRWAELTKSSTADFHRSVVTSIAPTKLAQEGVTAKRALIAKVLTAAQSWRNATLPNSADPPGTQLALRDSLRSAVYELAGLAPEPIDSAIRQAQEGGS